MNWYMEVMKKYAVFEGRAHRTEFWMFVLFNFIISFALGIVQNAIGLGSALSGLYTLAILVPSIAVSARRLHDTGRSGWWQLIGLIPLIGFIVLIVFYVQDSKADNKFGANPKAAAA